jgi:serine O-acetyltransferase
VDNSRFSKDLKKFYIIDLGTENPPRRRKIKFWIMNFGLHCVAVYRFGQFSNYHYRKSKIIGIPCVVCHRILNFIINLIHHVSIDADIGPGLYIGHVGTIYIGPTSIGENFSITHNVTIGIGYSDRKTGVPMIGNNVWIGTGAVLTGKISIGNGVTITPGSIVTRSIKDNCMVAGNPARTIDQNYDNKKLLV